MAANPLLTFTTVATESGTLEFKWTGDNGYAVDAVGVDHGRLRVFLAFLLPSSRRRLPQATSRSPSAAPATSS